MARYRIKVRQELIYEVEADDEDAAWELTEADDFGDPCEAVWSGVPDVRVVRLAAPVGSTP